MPTKKTTGTNTTKKSNAHVRAAADLGPIFPAATLYTGEKIPVITTPSIIIAKKGAISLPASQIDMQNKAMKKTKTALWEIFCSKISPHCQPWAAKKIKQRQKSCKAAVRNICITAALHGYRQKFLL
jgi:hypothetical protein